MYTIVSTEPSSKEITKAKEEWGYTKIRLVKIIASIVADDESRLEEGYKAH